MHLRRSFALFAGLLVSAAPPAQDTRPASGKAEQDLIRIANEVEKEVEGLRGWKFKHPVKKGVYTEAELRVYIEKKLFEEEYGGGKLEKSQSFLRMVGLIPKDCDFKKTMVDVLLNQIGGFYDPATQSFYMLKRSGVEYGPVLDRVLIAHELTHALDDQYVDLEKLMKSKERTEDWSLAISSVSEGSATALMTVYMGRLVAAPGFDKNQLEEAAKAEALRSKAFFEAPPYFATIAATYMCGLHFLLRGDLTALAGARNVVGEEVLAAAKDPPRSTEQILHPDKYWKRSERDEPVVVDDAWTEKRLAELTGWRVAHKDTVGELLCAVLTAPRNRKPNPQLMMNANYWTNTAAKGWGGDRFFLLSPKEDAAAERAQSTGRGVWITAWDTAKDADEFVRAYEENLPEPARVTVRIGKATAAFLYGFDAAGAQTLARALTAAPPPATRDGSPWPTAAK